MNKCVIECNQLTNEWANQSISGSVGWLVSQPVKQSLTLFKLYRRLEGDQYSTMDRPLAKI